MLPFDEQNPMHRGFAVGIIVDAFIQSRECRADWIAAVPRSRKFASFKNIPLRLTPRVRTQLAAWRKVARKVTCRGSVGSLVAAALYWRFSVKERAA